MAVLALLLGVVPASALQAPSGEPQRIPLAKAIAQTKEAVEIADRSQRLGYEAFYTHSDLEEREREAVRVYAAGTLRDCRFAFSTEDGAAVRYRDYPGDHPSLSVGQGREPERFHRGWWIRDGTAPLQFLEEYGSNILGVPDLRRHFLVDAGKLTIRDVGPRGSTSTVQARSEDELDGMLGIALWRHQTLVGGLGRLIAALSPGEAGEDGFPLVVDLRRPDLLNLFESSSIIGNGVLAAPGFLTASAYTVGKRMQLELAWADCRGTLLLEHRFEVDSDNTLRRFERVEYFAGIGKVALRYAERYGLALPREVETWLGWDKSAREIDRTFGLDLTFSTDPLDGLADRRRLGVALASNSWSTPIPIRRAFPLGSDDGRVARVDSESIELVSLHPERAELGRISRIEVVLANRSETAAALRSVEVDCGVAGYECLSSVVPPGGVFTLHVYISHVEPTDGSYRILVELNALVGEPTTLRREVIIPGDRGSAVSFHPVVHYVHVDELERGGEVLRRSTFEWGLIATTRPENLRVEVDGWPLAAEDWTWLEPEHERPFPRLGWTPNGLRGIAARADKEGTDPGLLMHEVRLLAGDDGAELARGWLVLDRVAGGSGVELLVGSGPWTIDVPNDGERPLKARWQPWLTDTKVFRELWVPEIRQRGGRVEIAVGSAPKPNLVSAIELTAGPPDAPHWRRLALLLPQP